MFSRPLQHGQRAMDQLNTCSSCRGEMSESDFHQACIVCLGAKHAFDAVHAPGGVPSCPACAMLSRERLLLRLGKARQWCFSSDADSDPHPGRRHPGSLRTASLASVGLSGSSAAVRGTPGGAASSPVSSGGSQPLSNMGQGQASQSSISSREDPVDEDAEGELPSFQRPSSDVHMVSSRHDDSAGAPERASPLPRGAAARFISFQAPPDLYGVLRGSDAGSVASESPVDPLPVLEVFKKAAERMRLPWPSAAAPPQTEAAADPNAWFGLRPPPPPQPRDTVFPPARGFEHAVHQSWEAHKHPPRYRWILDVEGADAMGITRLPPMDRTLAFTLNSYYEDYARDYNKSTSKPKKPLRDGFDINARIPFLDQGAKQAALDDRQLFEVLGFSTRDMNALSILLGSLRAILQLDYDKPYTAEELELDRLSELAQRVSQHIVQWHGRLMDMLILQERARWLDPLPDKAFPNGQSVRAILSPLPSSPTELFAGGLDLLRSASQARRQQTELSESLSLPATSAPVPTKAAVKEKPEKSRGRSTSRKGNAQNRGAQSSTRMQSASPAPTQNPSVASVVTVPPPQQRARSQSRGRGSKQGK